MGPVEITFFIVVAIFGAIGIIRNYHRELGVTLMLLLALFLILFTQAQFPEQVDQVIGFIFGTSPTQIAVGKAITYTIFLIVILFISYQGETLVFPGTERRPLLGLLLGLLNGWLFAGTIWYYNALAGWPLFDIHPPFTPVYNALFKILPPQVLSWQFLLFLVAILLILRVWR